MTTYNCKITLKRESENAFAVVLIEAPPFPDDKPYKETVHVPLLAVIAANDDTEEWGYVDLLREEKTCIGDQMLKDGVPSYEWMYCELYEV